MNILAIDTSGPSASAALVCGGTVKGEFFINNGMTHSETIMPLIEDMLSVLDFDKKNIDYIAVTCGPGSFTGLRIGMGSAKGLAAALSKNIIAVPTLDVIAEGAVERRGIIVPVMDARRNQVYFSIYNSDGYKNERIWDYEARSIDEVIETVSEITDDALFIGDGSPVFKDAILKAGFDVSGALNMLQRAGSLGILAEREAEKGKFVSPAEASLLYLRKSQAERELEERKRSVVFRAMEEGDIAKIAEIEKKCFSIPWSEKMIEDDYKNGLTYYIICESMGEVIGYAGMWHVINEGHITNIAVTPQWQGRGLGGRLMEELIALAKQKEMIGITLEARVSNEKALKLYEKYGFKSEGIRPDYYSDNHEGAVIMWKKLK